MGGFFEAIGASTVGAVNYMYVMEKVGPEVGAADPESRVDFLTYSKANIIEGVCFG